MGDLFWICKNSSSSSLSQSSARTEARIRRHVQARRNAPDNTSPWNERSASGGSFTRLDFRLRKSVTKTVKEDCCATQTPSTLLLRWPTSYPWTSTDLGVEERRSLAFFQARTSRECSGWLDYDFWNTRVLQLAQHSKVVVHSLVTLAAMHEIMILEASPSRSMSQWGKLHWLFQTSNTKLVETVNAPNLTYLEALVSCLVIICSRSLKRCPDAFRLLRAGRNMLEEYDRQERGQDAELVQNEIKPLFERLQCRPCCIADPLGSLRIARQIASKVSIADHFPSPKTALKFEDIQQAKESLQSIFDWYQNTPTSVLDVVPQARFLLDAWHTALADMEPEAAEIQPKNLLRAASLCGGILMEVYDSDTEMVFDDYISHFRIIVDLIEGAICSSEFHFSFGIDGGVVGILAFVGSKCRDPLIRRRSMRLLLDSNRIEGDRIPSIPGYITSALIDLEERGLAHVTCCSVIPPANRYTIIEGSQFYAEKRVRLVFRSGDGKEQECETFFDGQTREWKTSQPADVVFRAGYAAFLEDEKTGMYYEMRIRKFVFPMPRV